MKRRRLLFPPQVRYRLSAAHATPSADTDLLEQREAFHFEVRTVGCITSVPLGSDNGEVACTD